VETRSGLSMSSSLPLRGADFSLREWIKRFDTISTLHLYDEFPSHFYV
jgi:hypothetical protein